MVMAPPSSVHLATHCSKYLSPPTDAENQLLAKFNAGEHIRLACQCRVTGDITVRPMIPAKDGVTAPRRADPLGWGMERELAVMFVDVRGFSRISEGSLPYDVVYILNSLFDEVGAAIEGSNGYIDKFMGDGIMALFGLARPPGEACKDALRGGLAAHAAAARASLALEQHLTEPIRIGVGIHTGQAVVGRVGKTSDQVAPSRLTAIGDTVNIAARLESATKELACGLVVSLQTIDRAEISIPDHIGETSKISVHNISEPVDVVAIHDLEGLKAVMDGEIPQPPPRRHARQAKTTAKKRAPNTKSTTRKRRPRAVTTAPNTRKSRKKNLPQ